MALHSAREGRDALFGIVKDSMSDVTRVYGYEPRVIWSQAQSAPTLEQSEAWIYVTDEVREDRQRTLGRVHKNQVNGVLLVSAMTPKKPETLMKKSEEAMDCIKHAFINQNRIGGLIFRNMAVSPMSPIAGWNRVALSLAYQFLYVVAARVA